MHPGHLKMAGTVVKVYSDEETPERCINIGANLQGNSREQLIALLKSNKENFAWSVVDIPRIDKAIISYELNIDPTFKPIKQERRNLGPDHAQNINDEVDRLLSAGSIREVKYLDWLANPVLVKKKNGK